MHVSKSANHINKIANHPDVRPTIGVGGVSFLDLTSALDTSIFLEDKGGVWAFSHEGNDVYEGHYAFLPKYRGKHALKLGRQALDYMFTEIGAKRIIGRQNAKNKLASVYNTALGIKKGPLQKVTRQGVTYMAQIFTIDKEDWLCH